MGKVSRLDWKDDQASKHSLMGLVNLLHLIYTPHFRKIKSDIYDGNL